MTVELATRIELWMAVKRSSQKSYFGRIIINTRVCTWECFVCINFLSEQLRTQQVKRRVDETICSHIIGVRLSVWTMAYRCFRLSVSEDISAHSKYVYKAAHTGERTLPEWVNMLKICHKRAWLNLRVWQYDFQREHSREWQWYQLCMR